MVYKRRESALKNLKRIERLNLLPHVVSNATSKDGEYIQDLSGRDAA